MPPRSPFSQGGNGGDDGETAELRETGTPDEGERVEVGKVGEGGGEEGGQVEEGSVGDDEAEEEDGEALEVGEDAKEPSWSTPRNSAVEQVDIQPLPSNCYKTKEQNQTDTTKLPHESSPRRNLVEKDQAAGRQFRSHHQRINRPARPSKPGIPARKPAEYLVNAAQPKKHKSRTKPPHPNANRRWPCASSGSTRDVWLPQRGADSQRQAKSIVRRTHARKILHLCLKPSQQPLGLDLPLLIAVAFCVAWRLRFPAFSEGPTTSSIDVSVNVPQRSNHDKLQLGCLRRQPSPLTHASPPSSSPLLAPLQCCCVRCGCGASPVWHDEPEAPPVEPVQLFAYAGPQEHHSHAHQSCGASGRSKQARAPRYSCTYCMWRIQMGPPTVSSRRASSFPTAISCWRR